MGLAKLCMQRPINHRECVSDKPGHHHESIMHVMKGWSLSLLWFAIVLSDIIVPKQLWQFAFDLLLRFD